MSLDALDGEADLGDRDLDRVHSGSCELRRALVEEGLHALPLVVTVEPPPPLGSGPAYDFVNRTLIPSASGGPLMRTGVAGVAQWMEKCLHTRQGESPACDPSFGVRILPTDLLDGGVLDEDRLGAAEEDWTRALTTHPRSSSLSDWEVTTDDDGAVCVTFRAPLEGLGDTVLEVDQLRLTGGA